MPSIETTALTKRYGSTTAVNQLDLSVPEDTVYGFLGPNGAGKTTTMRILTGLTTPTSGSATIAGVPVTDRDSLRPHIGYLPEEPPLYEQATAYEQLEYLAGLRDLPSRETQDRIDELLGRLDLSPNDAATRIAEYSKGMRQKVAYVQAVLHDATDDRRRGVLCETISVVAELATDLCVRSNHDRLSAGTDVTVDPAVCTNVSRTDTAIAADPGGLGHLDISAAGGDATPNLTVDSDIPGGAGDSTRDSPSYHDRPRECVDA